ncbi:larval cuticle protein LCP-17-like [Cydia splendana]|uniref:larval cuticle protein LCP-17-like n=1 Tax=Cydia splendana TaxID=1100963 RepID=UPI00300C045D
MTASKFLVAFALAVACVHADVSHVVRSGEQAAEVISSVSDVRPDGFNYAYETNNGIQAQAEGVVQDVNSLYHADVSHVVRSGEQAAEVVSSVSDVRPDGFNYAYETNNGIQAQAEGVVQDVNSENPKQVVRGSYSYRGDDGQTYQVNYVADENGFQPEGAHLPVAPAIPEAIARSIEYIRTHASQESVRSAAPVASAPVVSAARAVVAPARVVATASASAFRQPNKQFGRF